MNKNDILECCQQSLEKFKKNCADIPFQAKGILNSEALLVCALAEKLGAKQIIESGRARGQSTLLFASYFKESPDFKIFSIELLNYTKDSIICKKRLKNFRNVNLLFGDTEKKAPRLVKEHKSDSIIVIDGPKGLHAIKLALNLAKNDNVKAILIHDIHSNAEGRTFLEENVPNVFFSDDIDFVKQFQHLDDNCWGQMKNFESLKEGWAPYMRAGKKIKSYGNTFATIFNSAEQRQKSNKNLIKLDNKLIRSTTGTIKLKLALTAHSIKNFALYPFNLIRHSQESNEL